MAKTPEELLSLRVGGATVAENIQRAINSGKLVEDKDGMFRFTQTWQHSDKWARVNNGRSLGCRFLMFFLFQQAYARSAVPHGCSACYKVKVSLRTLRELVAAWGIGKQIACQSKWGLDIGNPYSPDVYAGYIYTDGLDMARVIFKIAREAIDNDPKLGPDIAMRIKRGCSAYEAALGPSDRYEFAPEMAELEAYLKGKVHDSKAQGTKPVPMAKWIETAYSIGDDTYLDFTGGKRLQSAKMSLDFMDAKRMQPPQVAYDP